MVGGVAGDSRRSFWGFCQSCVFPLVGFGGVACNVVLRRPKIGVGGRVTGGGAGGKNSSGRILVLSFVLDPFSGVCVWWLIPGAV